MIIMFLWGVWLSRYATRRKTTKHISPTPHTTCAHCKRPYSPNTSHANQPNTFCCTACEWGY